MHRQLFTVSSGESETTKRVILSAKVHCTLPTIKYTFAVNMKWWIGFSTLKCQLQHIVVKRVSGVSHKVMLNYHIPTE